MTAGLAALAAACALAGCATDEDLTALQEMPSYQVGYNDGCATSLEEGKSFSTKNVRDKHAFDNDKAYRAGWRQGYLQCKQRNEDALGADRILGDRSDN